MPYFGKWPVWIDLYFYSCYMNPMIDFYFFTDCPKPNILPDNVLYHYINWQDYCGIISKSLDIEFNHKNPYKLCDIRPFYGLIHQNLLVDYDFWGYGDIDVCYGNINKWITDKILEKYDVISSHSDRVSGHFCLIRNIAKFREIPLTFYNWKNRILEERVFGFDEYDVTGYNFPNIYWAHRAYRYLGKPFGIGLNVFFDFVMRFFTIGKRIYMKEQWTSQIPKNGEWWTYDLEDGSVRRFDGKELPYLHYLFFKKTPFYQTDHYWKDDFYKIKGMDFETSRGKIVFTNDSIRYISNR